MASFADRPKAAQGSDKGRITREMPQKKTMPGSAEQPGPADVTKRELPSAPRKG